MLIYFLLKIDCLGYFDVISQEWVCEDRDVNEKLTDLFCGFTGNFDLLFSFSRFLIFLLLDHLTNFALLLDGNGNDSSDPISFVIAYLSAIFVFVALIFILFGVLLVEIRMRLKIASKEKELRRIAMLTKESSL